MDADRPQFTKQMQQGSGSYELVVAAVLFGLIGLFVDRWLGTVPIFTIVLVVFALVGASISIYYRYKNEISRLQQETAALLESKRAAGNK